MEKFNSLPAENAPNLPFYIWDIGVRPGVVEPVEPKNFYGFTDAGELEYFAFDSDYGAMKRELVDRGGKKVMKVTPTGTGDRAQEALFMLHDVSYEAGSAFTFTIDFDAALYEQWMTLDYNEWRCLGVWIQVYRSEDRGNRQDFRCSDYLYVPKGGEQEGGNDYGSADPDGWRTWTGPKTFKMTLPEATSYVEIAIFMNSLAPADAPNLPFYIYDIGVDPSDIPEIPNFIDFTRGDADKERVGLHNNIGNPLTSSIVNRAPTGEAAAQGMLKVQAASGASDTMSLWINGDFKAGDTFEFTVDFDAALFASKVGVPDGTWPGYWGGIENDSPLYAKFNWNFGNEGASYSDGVLGTAGMAEWAGPIKFTREIEVDCSIVMIEFRYYGVHPDDRADLPFYVMSVGVKPA